MYINLEQIFILQRKKRKREKKSDKMSDKNYYMNNTHGTRDNPGRAGNSGFLVDSRLNFIGAIATSIGIRSDFMAEIMAAIRAIEKTISENWVWVWIEIDSSLFLSMLITIPPQCLSIYLIAGSIV